MWPFSSTKKELLKEIADLQALVENLLSVNQESNAVYDYKVSRLEKEIEALKSKKTKKSGE